jgi:hypothetical protein
MRARSLSRRVEGLERKARAARCPVCSEWKALYVFGMA